ncbi:hypothetical protein [Acetomicrobium sp.]|uniref:hypothetical protein n=1 Tax=Acetomicrobium sp. TaxID=1872099 RepID=UPI003D967D98
MGETEERSVKRIHYPLAEAIPQEQLDAEIAELERIEKLPLIPKILGYIKLGGPGFIGAAFTLGAGTVTSSMLSGSIYGYKTMCRCGGDS